MDSGHTRLAVKLSPMAAQHEQRRAQPDDEGQCQGDCASIRQGPSADRGGGAFGRDHEPRHDVDRQTGPGPDRHEDEDEADEVGVDPESSRQPPRHATAHAIRGAAP